MVLPGHLAGGYLATTILLTLTSANLPANQKDILYVIGILAGEGPDIDLLWFYFHRKSSHPKKKESHRDYHTHAPIVWLGLSLLIIVFGWLINYTFDEYLGLVILCGSMSHFILDSIEVGIKWLWPFSDKRFSLRKVLQPNVDKEHGSFGFYFEIIRKHYIKNVTFYVEVAITFIAIYFAFFCNG